MVIDRRYIYIAILLGLFCGAQGQLMIPGVVASSRTVAVEEDFVIYYTNFFDRTPNAEYTEAMIEADYTSDGFVSCTNNTNIYNWNSQDTGWRAYYKAEHCCNCAGGDVDPTLPTS